MTERIIGICSTISGNQPALRAFIIIYVETRFPLFYISNNNSESPCISDAGDKQAPS